jgi:tetratricopeptide (TPR) repeat protein
MGDAKSAGGIIMDHQAAVEILSTNDSFQLAEAIQANGDSLSIGETYLRLGLDLYWKSKNLPATVVVSQMGIHYCLTKTRDGNGETETRAKALDSAKKMAYNLASFCWPGWDEPGIVIRSGEVEIGADAAKLNLRLAQELKRPPLGMSMAHWMLGAYALAQKQFDRAAEDFQKSLEFAREAKTDGQVMLNEGFIALSKLGMSPSSDDGEFMRILQSLDAINNDDAREYARQLQTARKVFDL